jgi:CheY-like chemotaxis protein
LSTDVPPTSGRFGSTSREFDPCRLVVFGRDARFFRKGFLGEPERGSDQGEVVGKIGQNEGAIHAGNHIFLQGRLRNISTKISSTPVLMNSAKPLRILLVEDQELVRTTLKLVLQALGHEVWEACHGREALEHLRQAMPDVILSDIDMPVMNGEAMCRALSQDTQWAQLPVVLMTGHDYPGMERARQLLPHSCSIGKPFTFEQLQECLARVLNRMQENHPRSAAESA